jgi:hypothetical protein
MISVYTTNQAWGQTPYIYPIKILPHPHLPSKGHLLFADVVVQWRAQQFFSGGVQQIHLRTEGREPGNLGAVAP